MHTTPPGAISPCNLLLNWVFRNTEFPLASARDALYNSFEVIAVYKPFLIFTVIVAICVALLSCGQADIPPETTAPTTEPTSTEPQLRLTPADELTVILHAGGALDGKRLLNCQEAFYYYYALGYRLFEYDLRLSSDGKLIGTHNWEHLSDGYHGIDYESFISLRLEGGYTPVNEDWLMDMLKAYPDVTVIVDAKMEDTLQDAEVIKRLNKLQAIHGIDLSQRIIAEIFSTEMWDALKDEVSFTQFLFSRYKVYYSIGTIEEAFPVDRFIGVALPYNYLDGYYKRNIAYLQQCGYRIFMFGVDTSADIIGAAEIGADTVYIDDPSLLPS